MLPCPELVPRPVVQDAVSYIPNPKPKTWLRLGKQSSTSIAAWGKRGTSRKLIMRKVALDDPELKLAFEAY